MNAEQASIPVGISSCLLSEQVRYDGGHKKHTYTKHTLCAYLEFKGLCPEPQIGLGVPRKTIWLTRSESEIGCVESNDSYKDTTHRMRVCPDEQLQWQHRLYGYLLKKDSPTCGMEDVKIWDARVPSRNGVGIYAARLMDSLPCLPVEEKGAG